MNPIPKQWNGIIIFTLLFFTGMEENHHYHIYISMKKHESYSSKQLLLSLFKKLCLHS